MHPKQSGRIGLLAICYYMATTLIAVIVITIVEHMNMSMCILDRHHTRTHYSSGTP